MEDKSMILINGEMSNGHGGSDETFKLIPIRLECPYNEAVFGPKEKVLFVISKEKKKNLHKVKNNDVVIEKYYEYHITTEQEIINFINMFCENAVKFDYHKYF